MSARKLFDKPKKKIKRKIKSVKVPKKYREPYYSSPNDELNNPKRYRYLYDDIDAFPDDKVEWLEINGYPEEKDDARSIIKKRKMKRLVTYGY
jgi:hypothetical protein